MWWVSVGEGSDEGIARSWGCGMVVTTERWWNGGCVATTSLVRRVVVVVVVVVVRQRRRRGGDGVVWGWACGASSTTGR